ncbi:DNA polymerase III subunit gamma/tau [Flaviaesturariibacter aridisoli]|uniref:DNA polymerase III subunit gamma/tau n=1 Tax=Flaviaesturariibacter aridisoli TaxID=2545761 RepID=A0A4R4E0A2_9BACT|nr:DNA polymerase III subunit gamma/tau [Flaviaesturariibacter aridisoli]TCZ68616.1 DNA polymerase III subunit gamma/tau [Flaviaesturariibacter aridisoli]
MEKFIVSARKYRPQTFDTVVGQEHITTTLRNAIKTGHLAHAFLFCGPRGVGKTTCARIFAKTINCENQTPEGEACDVCNSCKSFNEGTSMNIHELDAASNNSVDDIRALVEQVRFAPQAGKYKVYIIDEVHMLSQAAFNAFLKTLEEPPSYAKFILATTEKHKILPTILSRCQIFDFKRITLQDTVNHLAAIATKEGVKAEETGLQLIAQKSEGCMRDALSILDKIVSFTSGELTYNNTLEHLNILDADYYFRLMDCMLDQDLAGALLLFDDINKKGFEGDSVLNGFAEFGRNLLICKDARVAGLLEVVESFRKRYADYAQKVEAGYLVSMLNLLNEAEAGFRTARNKRLHVELTLIKLCYLRQAIQLTADGSGIAKKKVTDNARVLAFKAIPPFVLEKNPSATAYPAPTEAKLVIEEPKPQPVVAPAATVKAAPEPPRTPSPAPSAEALAKADPAPKARFNLAAIRNQAAAQAGMVSTDHPLTPEKLAEGWKAFIQVLKDEKNPAWNPFEMAQVSIREDHVFEAVVNDNIAYRFLETERAKATEFLKTYVGNRQLQMLLTLVETNEPIDLSDLPLTSREQFMKLAEKYPLVQELRDRLRLELDY